MRNSEVGILVATGAFLLPSILILSPMILGARALDVTYTSTTTFTTNITHISTREVYETITRTQASRWYSTFTDTFTMEGPAPYIQILSQQWQRPVLILVLYNGGGLGTVRIALYDGGRYLGHTDMGAPQPGQTMTYNLRTTQATTGIVYASILGTQGYPVAVTTMRVETYTGETVVVETRFRTRYFETSIEKRVVASTFVGTRPAGLFEDPIQLAVLALVLAGGTGVGALVIRLRHASQREKPSPAGMPPKPMPEAPPVAKETKEPVGVMMVRERTKEVKEVPPPKIIPIAETKLPLDDRVYNYIVEHEGVISISQTAREFAISVDELKQVIERLKSQGRLG